MINEKLIYENMKKTLVSILVLVSLTACNQGNEATDKKGTERKEASTESHDHQNDEEIHLKNGEKWTINEEMKPHINSGAEILNKYLSKNDSDYLALADQLKAQNSALIKSCTMKGEAHDELHKWLHPHIKLIDQLKEAENHEAAQEVIVKLENSFQNFKKYFQ